MIRPATLRLGLGIGWRPEIALAIDRRDRLGFIEVVAEQIEPRGELPPPIERLIERGLAVIPHGISLSLGGAEPLDRRRLAALSNLAERLKAPIVSEHIAFVRGGGMESGHLLPLPRTREAIELVVGNILQAKDALPVPLALENIASLFEWPGAEMDEATFLTEVLERADVLMLLDIENVYANALNHGYDPVEFLDRLPLERIAYVHVAGGCSSAGACITIRTPTMCPRVCWTCWRSYVREWTCRALCWSATASFRRMQSLNAELDAIAAAVSRGTARRAFADRSTNRRGEAACRYRLKLVLGCRTSRRVWSPRF